MVEYDAVIVGAGILGLSTAYQLRRNIQKLGIPFQPGLPCIYVCDVFDVDVDFEIFEERRVYCWRLHVNRGR